MNGKINTPRTVCKAIVAVAIAAIAVAAIIGCSSLGGGSRRQSIATVIQTAYDLGAREIAKGGHVVLRSGVTAFHLRYFTFTRIKKLAAYRQA